MLIQKFGCSLPPRRKWCNIALSNLQNNRTVIQLLVGVFLKAQQSVQGKLKNKVTKQLLDKKGL